MTVELIFDVGMKSAFCAFLGPTVKGHEDIVLIAYPFAYKSVISELAKLFAEDVLKIRGFLKVSAMPAAASVFF